MISDNYTLLRTHLQKNSPEIYKLIADIDEEREVTNSKFSHNLKNIVSIVSSSLQLIESQHPETADFNLWPQLKDAVALLIEFMNQESLYRHSNSIEPKPLNLQDLLWSIPDFMDEIYDDNTQFYIRNYTYDISPELPDIKGDYSKLKYALIEIVKNSYEATSNDDNIIIRAHAVDNTIKIEIEDDGTGIDKSIINQVVTPFFTTKKLHTGTGLSIANRIVCAHGGNMLISSDFNTHVILTLPTDN